MVENVRVERRGRPVSRTVGGVVVVVRPRGLLRYELRHRRLAAEARRELRRVLGGPPASAVPFEAGVPDELWRLIDAAEASDPLDRDEA
jgi:hypothetical protein